MPFRALTVMSTSTLSFLYGARIIFPNVNYIIAPFLRQNVVNVMSLLLNVAFHFRVSIYNGADLLS